MMALEAPKIHLEGKLGDAPFPRVLQYLHERNVTGRLRLERGKVVKEIFLVEGRPVNVESNLRDETLGRFLVKNGKITEEEFEKSVALMIEHSIQQGAALVKLGCLSPKELYHQVKDQTRKKLLTGFSWSEGDFRFSPGVDFVEDIYRFEMPVPRLMCEGVMGYFPAKLIERELARVRPGAMLPAAGFVNRIGAYGLDERESAFIMAIDGEKDLAELREALPGFAGAARLIYLLVLSGLMGVDGEPEAALRNVGEEDLTMPAVEDFISPARKAPAPKPKKAASARVAPQAPKDAPVPAEQEPDDKSPERRYLDLSDDEVVDEWHPQEDQDLEEEKPAARPRSPLIVEEEDEEPIEVGEDEGPPEEEEEGEEWEGGDEADGGVPPTLAEVPFEVPPDLSDTAQQLRDESEILEYYMGIKNLDYFAMLRVSPDAGDQEVTRAYQTLRARYYKQRFPADLSAEAADKLEEIHAQIIRAYEQLRTASGRKAYLASQQKPSQPPAVKNRLRAEQYLQRGMAHVRKREWSGAQAMFEKAVETNPTDPEYKGYLGWTIYSNSGLDLAARREKAKKLLKESIHLNPHGDTAHVFLGKIFKDEGLAEDAVNEFELAVLCNPKCKEAERELQRHEAGEW